MTEHARSAVLEALDALAARDGTLLSVWYGDLNGTEWLTRLPDHVHLAASTIKLPLVVALHRLAAESALTLDDEVPVRARFDSAVSGSYEVTQDYDNDDEPWQRLGGTATLRWLAERSIIRSSNLATNLLVERVGFAAVEEVFRLAGATGSALRRGIQDSAAGAAGLSNTATARDLAAVVVALLDGRLLAPGAAAEVEALLARNEWNDAVPAGLPPGTYVAHKTGWIDECCHDVGVVRPADEPPFVLAVLSTLRTPDALDEAEAHALVADAAGAVWRFRGDLRR